MRVVDHTSPIRPGHLLILTMRVVRIVRVAVDGFNIFMILRLYVSHCVGPCFAIQRLPQGKWRVSSLAGTQTKTPSSHRAAASPTRDSPRMCNRRPQGKYNVPCTLCRSEGKGGRSDHPRPIRRWSSLDQPRGEIQRWSQLQRRSQLQRGLHFQGLILLLQR